MTEKLSLSAIKDYKSILSVVLHHKRLDITSDRDLHDIIRRFQIQVPRRTFTVPNWDLDIVLKAKRCTTLRAFGTSRLQGTLQEDHLFGGLGHGQVGKRATRLFHQVTFIQDDLILAYRKEFFQRTDAADKPLR